MGGEGSRRDKTTITNDGATILKSVWLDNPAAKILVGRFCYRFPPIHHTDNLIVRGCQLSVIDLVVPPLIKSSQQSAPSVRSTFQRDPRFWFLNCQTFQNNKIPNVVTEQQVWLS